MRSSNESDNRDSQSTRFLRDSGRDSKRLNPLLNRGNGESPLEVI
jgi:hypothetical protein